MLIHAEPINQFRRNLRASAFNWDASAQSGEVLIFENVVSIVNKNVVITLYVHNVRGFSSTFLTLKDVNFLVGENSTGKTSMLRLIGIMASDGFWNSREFGRSELSFGSFYDTISSGEPTATFFEVGIFGVESRGSDILSAIKLRYIERDNAPFLKEIWIINDHLNVQISIEGEKLKYKYEHLELKRKPLTNSGFFKAWVKNNKLEKRELFEEPLNYVSIMSILGQVESSIQKRSITVNPASIELNRPMFPSQIAWFSPTRSEPKKTYDSDTHTFHPQGRHAPFILTKIIDEKHVRSILRRFGQDSGLFKEIKVQVLKKGKTLRPNNPFQIIVKLEPRSDSRNIADIGYGVSQVLPIIIEVIARPDGNWFSIQQPEIHIHPRAQAALGDFVFKSLEKDRQRFIIETHSDYIIDRFRLRVNRAFNEHSETIKASISQVVFFERIGNENRLTHIEIQPDGSYSDQPKSFREFFIKEQINLIRI